MAGITKLSRTPRVVRVVQKSGMAYALDLGSEFRPPPRSGDVHRVRPQRTHRDAENDGVRSTLVEPQNRPTPPARDACERSRPIESDRVWHTLGWSVCPPAGQPPWSPPCPAARLGMRRARRRALRRRPRAWPRAALLRPCASCAHRPALPARAPARLRAQTFVQTPSGLLLEQRILWSRRSPWGRPTRADWQNPSGWRTSGGFQRALPSAVGAAHEVGAADWVEAVDEPIWS